MSQIPEESSTSDGESAPIANINFLPYVPNTFDEGDPKTLACTTCKIVTTQFDFRIHVVMADPDEYTDVTKMMELSKVVLFCTNCGTSRLTK